VAENRRKRMEMFSVVGLTLDEVSSGSLPHNNLAKTLDNRMTKSNFRFAEIILCIQRSKRTPKVRQSELSTGSKVSFWYFCISMTLR